MRLNRGSYVKLSAVALGLIVAACAGGSSNSNDLFGTSTPASSGDPAPPIEGNGTSGGGTSGGTSGSSGSSGSSGQSSSGGTSGTTPKPKLEVNAQIISASLADDCGAAEKVMAPCADADNCPGFCQQSNMQINFKTGAGSAAKVKIVSVSLREATTDKELEQLDSKNPRAWVNQAYTPWNETLSPNTELKVTYDLSAPGWSKMGNTSFSAKYQLQVTIDVEGTTMVLESVDIAREPPVVT